MPSSPNYKRDYKQENKYKKKPDQVKKREERNQARSEAIRSGLVRKGDKRQVDHKTPLSKGGSNRKSNLRVVSAHNNDSFPRNNLGAMIHQNFALGSKKKAKKR